MNKITAVIKRPGEDAELMTIKNELHQLQEPRRRLYRMRNDRAGADCDRG